MTLPRRSPLLPMLVVAAVVALLYLPLMVWANYGPAARTLASGAELECSTALACATQLRNPGCCRRRDSWRAASGR